jgi:dTDP-4-amino-4,6-dideoxygalactose transaminase
LLISRNRDAIEEARTIANFGTELRITLRNGMNAKLSEYHGAVALAQLDRWDGIKERRRKTFALYQKHVAGQPDLTLQPGIEQAITSALMIRTARGNAAAVVNALNGRGIAAHRMYLPPLYHHPHFENLAVVRFDGEIIKGGESLEKKIAVMTNSETMHRDTFGLPFHAFLTETDIEYVMTSLLN